MSTELYQIAFSKNYERSLDLLTKHHYKKDREGANLAHDLFPGFLQALATNPFFVNEMRPFFFIEDEPWPGGYQPDGWVFRKLFFDLPRLRGAAREGRLMFMVNEGENLVLLLWVYSHDQYSKRPSDQHIETVMKQSLADL